MKGTLGTSSLSPRREGAPSGRSSSIGALEVLNPKSCVAIAAALHFGVEPWPFDTYVYIYINIYEHVFITLVRYCDATLFLQPRFFFLHVSPPLFFVKESEATNMNLLFPRRLVLVICLPHACVHLAAGTASL